ncbi:MAG: hypothetical protein JWQ88_1864 [Rhodoferax sp.]|nr:hypothetical protein [Rhodoferax sp.]
MQDSGKLRGLVMTRALSILVAASVCPLLWSVAVYPIDKQSVYVGPITLYMGISLVLWMTSSIAAICTSLWVHFRRPLARRLAWYAVAAGECAFATLFFTAGTFVSHTLKGHFVYDWGLLLYAAAVIGLIMFAPRALSE